MSTNSLFQGVMSGDRRRGFAELTERASRIAGGLSRLGVKQGDSVSILMRNDIAFLEAAYTLDHQLHGSPEWVRDALTTNKVRLAILACVEYTMDLPENNRRSRTVHGCRTMAENAAT